MTDILEFRSAEYYSSALRQSQKIGWCYSATGKSVETDSFPTVLFLHGMRSDYTGWWNNTKFAATVSKYPGLYVFANSDSHGWYSDGFSDSLRCEQAIIEDLIPWVKSTLPAPPSRSMWAVAGQSMGGYGALKLALKYPRLFGHALSFSGALNVTRLPEYHQVFGHPVADRAYRRANDLFYLAEEALCEMPIERPHISLNCGTEDPFVEASRAFHQHLQFLGYGHKYWEEKGQHTWPYWNRALRRALPELLAQMSPISGG